MPPATYNALSTKDDVLARVLVITIALLVVAPKSVTVCNVPVFPLDVTVLQIKS